MTFESRIWQVFNILLFSFPRLLHYILEFLCRADSPKKNLEAVHHTQASSCVDFQHSQTE